MFPGRELPPREENLISPFRKPTFGPRAIQLNLMDKVGLSSVFGNIPARKALNKRCRRSESTDRASVDTVHRGYLSGGQGYWSRTILVPAGDHAGRSTACFRSLEAQTTPRRMAPDPCRKPPHPLKRNLPIHPARTQGAMGAVGFAAHQHLGGAFDIRRRHPQDIAEAS